MTTTSREAAGTCDVGDVAKCPGDANTCSGNQCCPGNSKSGGHDHTCPSAERDFLSCTKGKLQDCLAPSAHTTTLRHISSEIYNVSDTASVRSSTTTGTWQGWLLLATTTTTTVKTTSTEASTTTKAYDRSGHYTDLDNDHCNGFAGYKRWCVQETCGQNSQGYDTASRSVEECMQKCDSLDHLCVAIGFKKDSQCITYEGQCVDSDDGVNWGIQFYKKRRATTSTIPRWVEDAAGGERGVFPWLHSKDDDDKSDADGSRTTAEPISITDSNTTNATAVSGRSEFASCGQLCNISAMQEAVVGSAYRSVAFMKAQARKSRKDGGGPYWMLAAGSLVVVVCSVGKTCANRGASSSSKDTYSNLSQGVIHNDDTINTELDGMTPAAHVDSPTSRPRGLSETDELNLFESALEAALNVPESDRQTSAATSNPSNLPNQSNRSREGSRNPESINSR